MAQTKMANITQGKQWFKQEEVSNVYQTPQNNPGIMNPINTHIPLKIYENLWYSIHLGVFLKSAKDLILR